MLVEVGNALMRSATVALEQALGENDIDIAHGPGEWDGEYIEELLTTLPAVRIALVGGLVSEETELSLRPAEWAIYIATGWGDCRSPEDLQVGADGTHAMLDALMFGMHNSVLSTDDGERIGFCRMQTLTNLWQGGFRRLRISVFQLTAVVDMPIVLSMPAGLDEFLRSTVDWDIEGGREPDMSDTIQHREGS